MRQVLKLMVVLLVFGSLSSCVSKKKYDELVASKEATDQALAETQSNLKNLQEEKDALAAQMAAETKRLNSELDGLKSELNSTKGQVSQMQQKLSMTEAELAAIKGEINGIFEAYSGSGLTVEEKDGSIYVMTSEKFNYRSGSARVSSDQRKAIKALAETLKSNPELTILVEGHTDDDQMVAGAPFVDNWELSTERALTVIRELVKAGVNPAQLAAAGRSDNEPVGDNETKDGKAMNRRTVIKADPNMKGLFEKAMKKN